MNALLSDLHSEAARILKENIVDAVIGFETGTLPMRSRPVCIRRPDGAKELVMDGFCRNNLATYLAHRPAGERTGIVCRGCESRAVRALVIEQQLDRSRLYLIGVPCRGILDEPKILSAINEEVHWAREEEAIVVLGTLSGEVRLERANLLHDACRRCRFPEPVGVDIRLGPQEAPAFCEAGQNQVAAFEALDADARHAFFAAETARCIRCYACRQACPMCYCTQCFVDHNAPRWIESGVSPAGTQGWHLMRAFHQTGRCVSCGACERACPMAIPMTYLTDKLNFEVEKTYGFVAGQDDQRPPPFASFSVDDAGRFES
jgi:formate dehydrogenase subunit beta